MNLIHKIIRNVFFLSFLFLLSCISEVKEVMTREQIDFNNIAIELDDSASIDASRFKVGESKVIFKDESNYAYADMTELSNHDLFLVCSQGDKIEDFQHNSLVYSISKDKGMTWSSPKPIELSLKDDYINVSMPSLLRLENGHLILCFAVKYNTDRIDVYMKESFDDGLTWQREKIVFAPDQGYQMLHNSRLLYDGKNILLPVSIPSNPKGHLRGVENISDFCYFSSDLGKTWQKTEKLTTNIGLLEPGITKVGPQEYLMNIRTNHGRILFARSNDDCKTWNFQPSSIKSPSSPQRIIKLKDSNKLLMVWNFTDKNYSVHGGNRHPLSLALSLDKGYTWTHLTDLEKETDTNDYSYSGIYETQDCIYVFYNVRYPNMRFAIKMVRITK